MTWRSSGFATGRLFLMPRNHDEIAALRETGSKYGHLLTDAEANYLFWEIFELMFADWTAEPYDGC